MLAQRTVGGGGDWREGTGEGVTTSATITSHMNCFTSDCSEY